jgi:hypothetical protein
MKRGKPPERRTALRSTGPISTRRAKPLPQQSARRKAKRPAREACRAEVIARDNGCAAVGLPGIPHGPLPGHAPAEVDELQRGQMRDVTFTDPDRCIALCAQAHRFKTTADRREMERLGLSLPSWATGEHAVEAATIRAAWRAGLTPADPSWW